MTQLPTEPGDDMDRDPQFATTLARGLEILRCFTAEDVVLGNSQLAARTQLSRPTVSRFTYTLTRLGYLRSDEAGKYMLGAAVLSLGYPMLAGMALRQLARPGMAALAAHAKGAVSMGLRDRLSVVYVETSRSPNLLSQQFSDVGMTHPLIASAMGNAYIASLAAAPREALINTIRVTLPQQWEEHSAVLAQNIRHYQRNGFCVSHGEFLSGFFSVGVPMPIASVRETYMFNCVIPASSVTAEMLETDIGPRLAALVRSLRP
jgi:DNA-binding IclR family transcriptional regulator